MTGTGSIHVDPQWGLAEALRAVGVGPTSIAKSGAWTRSHVSAMLNGRQPISDIPKMLDVLLDLGGVPAVAVFCQLTGVRVPEEMVPALLTDLSEITEVALTADAIPKAPTVEIPEWNGYDLWTHPMQVPMVATPPQVARGIGVSYESVRRYMDDGSLQTIRLSEHRSRIPRWSILQFLGWGPNGETPADTGPTGADSARFSPTTTGGQRDSG